MWRGIEAYASDLDSAATDLAGALMRGELALFLGAGISIDANLPSWSSLVIRCCEATGISSDDITPQIGSDTLRLRADQVEAHFLESTDYIKCVHDSLYATYPGLSQPTSLLHAIGALMMGSRRGSVRDIVTLNLDNVLETYLALHGYVPEVVTEPQRLRRNVDVTVYHPHGFLPKNQQDLWTKRIVLSQESFDQALDDEGPWKQQIRQMVTTKMPLAVGLSFSDPVLTSVISGAKKLIEKEGRPAAFWLMKKPETPEEIRIMNDAIPAMKKRKIVPVVLDSFDNYPKFLLSICQHAANEMQEQFKS